MKLILLALAVLLVAAASWQHLRYHGARRGAMQDRQSMIYGSDTFHLIVFLRTQEHTDGAVLSALRDIKAATDAETQLEWIYAGRAVANGDQSSQLGDVQWTSAFLLQAPSRAEADKALTGALGTALAIHPDVFVQGFDRPVLLNLALPQVLGLGKLASILRGEPSVFPFVRREAEFSMPEFMESEDWILRGESLTKNAAVVFNLQVEGTPEEQEANAAYARRLLATMGEGGYGPVHTGRGVRVAGEAEFENIVLVYYPGVRFFSDMLQSEFFQSIVGDKQLGDNQATITVPVLDRL